MQKQKNKTVVECYLSGCKYNSACCLDPYDFKNRKCYCTREHIIVDLDEENYEFQCAFFENGHKQKKCISCQIKENDGDIPLGSPDEVDVELFEDDDDFI